MKNIILLASALLLFVGCATQAPTPRVAQPSSQTFNAPKNAVWALLVSEVGLHYPVQAIEKESGLLTTDFVAMPVTFGNGNASQWIFPPGGFLTTWAGLRMKMSILATEPEPGKTSVTIRTHYEAFESNVSKSWVVCQSNGNIESGILSRVSQQIR